MFDTHYHHDNGIVLPYTKHKFWTRLESVSSWQYLSDNALYLYIWLLYTQDEQIEYWNKSICRKSFKKVIVKNLGINDMTEQDYMAAMNSMIEIVNEKKKKQYSELTAKSMQSLESVASQMNSPELTTFIQQLYGSLNDLAATSATI